MSGKKEKQARALKQENLQAVELQRQQIYEYARRETELMRNPMYQYNRLLKAILAKGEEREDRTGVGTKSIFAPNAFTFDLQAGFPLVSIKKTSLKMIAIELLWMLSGSTNIAALKEQGCNIWNAWADENGDLGAIYGKQWRATKAYTENLNETEYIGSIRTPHGKNDVYQTPNDSHYYIDQISELIEGLKHNPSSRRHVVSAWNVSQLKEMRLHPCHFCFQCYVENAGKDNAKLNLSVVLRSSDAFLGLPYNIAQYALLTHILARAANLQVGTLRVIFSGDVHLYSNHIEQATQIVARVPKSMPNLVILTENTHFDGYKAEDFVLEGYEHWGVVKGDVAV